MTEQLVILNGNSKQEDKIQKF